MKRTLKLDEANQRQKVSSLSYKSLIKFVKEYGDLVILGSKGTCKTTLLQHVARQLRKNPKNRVILLETFPNHMNTFDNIPYMVIKDSDVVEKEHYPYIEEDASYIKWSKDYTLVNKDKVIEALHKHKDLVFLIEIEDMERISAFMTFVIYYFYRKQYLRAKANSLNSVGEHVWILTEESHNLLDSTVIAKKTFNKLRKIQNEFRNLNMHLVCVALRLQDLSPKIRAKMSIILSRISLDDFQLKIRSLLRNSKYRKDITTLEKGKFVFPQLDQILEVKPFKQNGLPYQIMKPKVIVKKERQPNGFKEKILSALGEKFHSYSEEEIEYDSAYENKEEGEDDTWLEDSGFFEEGEW